MNNSSNSKSNTLFFVICIVLIIVFIVLFLYVRGINNNLKLKFEKNVFFVELDKKPYQAFDAYKHENRICVKGNYSTSRKIGYEDLKINPNDPKFLLMFWIKLDSKHIIDDKKKPSPNYYKSQVTGDTGDAGDTEDTGNGNNNILLFDNDRYQIKLNTINARITFKMNSNSTILSNVPYDKWFCLATLYTNNYTEIYLDGKLAETIQYTNDDDSHFNRQLFESKLEIGHYPGHLAYLVVSVKEKYFNSYSIYQEYLYYKNKILNSNKYNSKIDFDLKINLGLLDNVSNLYENERENTCYD